MDRISQEKRSDAERLCSVLEEFIAFVDQHGPYEQTGNFSYQIVPGDELTPHQMKELINLDAKVQELCIRLEIAPPEPSPTELRSMEVIFGYTRLKIEDWYSDDQPIDGKVLAPAVDWKHRMRSLQSVARGMAGPRVPKWDAQMRTLTLGGMTIKKYRNHPADNHSAILDAFEKLGWPSSIENPISIKRDAASAKQLRDTIYDMNKKLHPIRFSTLGDGVRVSWELVSS